MATPSSDGYYPVTRDNPLGLAPDWVYLRGQRMPVGAFLTIHASDMAACPDAKIAILIPAFTPSDSFKSGLAGGIGGLVAVVAAVLIKNGNAARIVGGAVSGYVGKDLAEFLADRLKSGDKVIIVPVSQLMETD